MLRRDLEEFSSSVVAGAAIVSRAQRRIRLADVAVDAPAHVERRCLIDLLHRLDLAVTRLTSNAGIYVPHVRKVHVLRKLVDAYPGHGLFLIPESGQLLNLRLVFVGGSPDDGVAAHAS